MTKRQPLLIGIGASAGGLEALQNLLESLDKRRSLSIVIVQHLSPTHQSLLSQILKNHSALPVIDITDGMKIKAKEVYVCPAATDILIDEAGKFVFSDKLKSKSHSPSPNVDRLLESLAMNWNGPKAGIILSGTGKDGSSGLQAIRFHGGITAAQDLVTAKYDGMPSSAQKTVHVDIVAPPEELIKKVAEFHSKVAEMASGKTEVKDELFHLTTILENIDDEFSTSFTRYKTATTFRRVYNRMATKKVQSIEKYAELIKVDASERLSLYRNMLIGVTDFFRDFSPFERFKEYIKEYLLEDKSKSFRGWIAGCSKGQEAYSMAMILSELIGNELDEWDIKLFATDIDESAIEFARQGIYADKEIENIPEEYLEKYFTYNNGNYHVEKSLREMLVFSRHDLSIDPPYVKLDIITCRNVLIYFQENLQNTVQRAFQFGLKHGGLLLLGRSEGLGQFKDNYEILDQTSKIFQLKNIPKATLTGYKPLTALHTTRPIKTKLSREGVTQHNLSYLMHEALNKAQFPNSIVLNGEDEVVFVGAKNQYMGYHEGTPTNLFFSLVHPDLQLPARVILTELKNSNGKFVESNRLLVDMDDESHWVKLLAVPIENADDLDSQLIVLTIIKLAQEDAVELSEIDSDAQSQAIKRLEIELTNSRNESKELLRELDGKNEELQVANEEMQSTNEELQTSNEELASTNEELEATVEELETAYTALRAAYKETEEKSKLLESSQSSLTRLNQDFKRSQQVAQIGHYKWDIETSQIEWSDQMYDIFDLPKDTPLTMEVIESRYYPEDKPKVQSELERLPDNGRFNLKYRLLKPNSTKGFINIHGQGRLQTNSNTGHQELVGTLQVIDNLIEIEEKARQFESRLASRISTSLTGIYIYSIEKGINTFINEKYAEITGYKLDELNKKSPEEFAELFHPDDRESVFSHMEELIHSEKDEVLQLQYRFKHKNGHWISLLSNDVVSNRNVLGEAIEFTGSFVDITIDELAENVRSHFDFTSSLFTEKLGVALVAADGVPIKVNTTLCDYLEFEEDEITSMSFEKFTHPDDVEKDVESFKKLMAGEIPAYQMTKRYLTKTGETFSANLNVNGFYDHKSTLQYVIATVDKLSEK